MTAPIRQLHEHDLHNPVPPEWLVTNGLGGYASSTVAGVLTRRYHGLLIASLSAPLGRMVMLSYVQSRLRTASGNVYTLETELSTDDREKPSLARLAEFRLEYGLPIWRFETDDFSVEKRVIMPYRQNTVHLSYRLLRGNQPVRLELRPLIHFRHYESALTEAPSDPYTLTAVDDRYEITAGGGIPPLRLLIHGCRSALTLDRRQVSTGYVEEKSRGYAHDGGLWSPGYFHMDLSPCDQPSGATLVASTEAWDMIRALEPQAAVGAETQRRAELLAQAPADAQSGLVAELVLAADQFIISPAGRTEDAARAKAMGTEARTVIAGYHWFTDWGRDTMISLDGLTLQTGRYREAAYILRTFADYVRDGLIPNMFPDGEKEGLYHTADATLWFFHAVDRYLTATNDRSLLKLLLPTFVDIVDHHVRGTRFGIGVDPADGLLRQGADGYQLTWMDAKVDDWVVTPRRGKAVEINALFYNALRLLEGWVRAERGEADAQRLAQQADRLRQSFNQRFWYAEGQYLYDVVDGEHGDDSSCRPNQIFAVSLTHPVLDRERWQPVFDTVRKQLLTPRGLRSLAPGHKDYRAQYYGDLRARDAAYHQGTVWAWLIGPFVDAWLRVAPDDGAAVLALVDAFAPHLSEAGIGSVSEIFDAETPFIPRGCIAQAWSVGELLRVSLRAARHAVPAPQAAAVHS